MEIQNKSSIEAYLFIGKAIIVFLSGGLVFHLIVMIIDYFLMIEPFYMATHENYTDRIFSKPMIPMMATYGLLSLGIYLIWNKAKNAALTIREKEFQQEKAEAVLKSLQRFTGILAEHIASQNSEIMSWIEFRKRSGHPVSANVEKPCRQIAKAIQSMAESTFIRPYTVDQPLSTSEFENFFLLGYPTLPMSLPKKKFQAGNEKQSILESLYHRLPFWKWIDRFSLSINTVSVTSPSWLTILAR